ncbi:MAG: ATP-binding cassette domain-containing protein [Rickettsiales bacterium]|nr:ATP-binding cassette domain-containing protein [Rickettsiales bacterium]
MSMIEFDNVHKSFGPKNVLRGVTINVDKGESLVVIGGSGSGKSVLLKHILGIHRPDTGKVIVDGIEVSRLSANAMQEMMPKFGMLFQGGALFDSLSIWENVAFGLIQGKRMKRSDAHDIALEKLKSVGLGDEVANLFPNELSGGMQKRVSLARSIATEPEIILFDEPTTGLDPIMADVINNLIVKCSKEIGATTITITHDMASARKIADKMAMLYEGTIIWHDDKDRIDSSQNDYVDQFIHGRAEGPIRMKI